MNADARAAILRGLIDDAGLFPPASLSMEEAVAGHRESLSGENGWLLGRFICPASRLSELHKRLPDEDPAAPWRVSVILGGTAGDQWLDEAMADLTAARRFAELSKGSARVDLLEVPLPQDFDPPLLYKFVDSIEDAGLRDPVTPFLEVPRAAPLPAMLETIAEVRDRLGERDTCRPPGAKLRCGGASEELFPTPARVASFIHWCNRLGIPLKATAGLHHPFRHVDPGTGFLQHGFVNLVGAAILASAQDLGAEAITQIVSDQDPASFSLAPDGFSWRDSSVSVSEIASARANLFRSYGSCSFLEPVEDLTRLGILPLT